MFCVPLELKNRFSYIIKIYKHCIKMSIYKTVLKAEVRSIIVGYIINTSLVKSPPVICPWIVLSVYHENGVGNNQYFATPPHACVVLMVVVIPWRRGAIPKTILVRRSEVVRRDEYLGNKVSIELLYLYYIYMYINNSTWN